MIENDARGARTAPAQQRASGFAAIERVMGATSLLILGLPLFLSLEPQGSSSQSFSHFEPFAIAALAGCVLGSGLSITLGSVRMLRQDIKTPLIAAAALAFSSGYLAALAMPWMEVHRIAVCAGGLLTGMGFVPLALAWSLLITTSDFRKMLLKGAVLCAAAVLANQALLACQPVVAALVRAALLVPCSFAPIRACLNGGLAFPTYDKSLSNAVEDGAFVSRSSLGDLALLLAGSTFGLMLFVLLSDSRHFLLVQNSLGATSDASLSFASETSLGLLCACLCSALGCLVKREKPLAPFIYWVLFPAIAGALIVLDSFPLGTPLFLVGATGVFVFSSLLGLFAAAFLLTASRQGEFSPLLVLGIPLALVSLAALAGHAFRHSGLDYVTRGEALLVVSTLYFVYMLVMPALQLWRARNSAHLEELETRIAPNEKDLSSRCQRLADLAGLSPREHEVLCYLGRGYNSPYIAKTLFISDSTVRSHLKSIYKKAGVSSRMELINLLERQR
ncbi:helix-turn-helix transcriptional regulator [Rubneribacter badeniensis]|uniref:helix-turn-helix transcriptional regulator n=1 Tax=Rubneribacter badeniensis TaxID=2070688 RepID=UPI003A8E1FF1